LKFYEGLMLNYEDREVVRAIVEWAYNGLWAYNGPYWWLVLGQET